MLNKLFLSVVLATLMLPSVCLSQLVSVSGDDSITVVMSGAAATTNPYYSSTWKGTTGGISTEVGQLNGVTAVAVVAAPASGNTKAVDSISIYNGDTAAVTITIRKLVGSTNTPLVKQAIASGATMIWNSSGVSYSTPPAVINVGAGAGTGTTVSEQGNGVVQKSVINLSALPVSMSNTTIQGGGTKIYDFPEGRVLILGVTASVTPTTTSAIASTINSGVAGVWALGTATPTADTALTGTEADLLPSTAWTSSTTINVAAATVTGALASSAQFDGTATAKDLNFNACVSADGDQDADGTMTWTGTVTVSWVYLGDY